MSKATLNDLYEADYLRWTEQERRLRERKPVDSKNIAGELEDLGRSQQQQLVNRLAVLLAYMLKSEFQPEKQSPGRRGMMKEQRIRIRRLLAKVPSLKTHLASSIEEACEIAVTFASAETGIVEEDFSAECPYRPEKILPKERKP